MKLEEAVSSIERCQSISDLTQTLRKISENYGFSAFNFLDIGATHLDVPFYIGTMKAGFASDYFANHIIRVDPCVTHARRRNTPFSWSDVPFPQYHGIRKSGAQKGLEIAADHGYREGMVVPFHFSDWIGRVYSSIIVFFWSDAVRDYEKVASSLRHDLHLIMLYWAQQAVELIDTQPSQQASFATRSPVLTCDAALTDRERDVLSWAARGKTAIDTADILMLSEETIKTHIRNALVKLEANNKTHGVTKALYLGLIDM